MKRTKVSDLKAHLSGYLAEVRGGATVVVCDRNTPIARLEPWDDAAGLQVRQATRTPAELRRIRGVRPKLPIDLDALLRLDRDQR